MESTQQLRIFNDRLRLCSGEVSVVWTGPGYFLAFMLQNGRFVFTTTRTEQAQSAGTERLRAANTAPDRRSEAATAAILFPFPSIIHGPFITGSLTSEEKRPANQSQLNKTRVSRGRPGVLTRQEGRLRAAGCGLERALERVRVRVVVVRGWSSDCSRWFTFKLGRVRARPRPPGTPPLVVSIQRAGKAPANLGGARLRALLWLA